jgi:anti-sigma regulatory factor (Ser/Thr protein kinase)
MSEILLNAIQVVRASKFSFCKFVSANDAGTTGAHQAGLYIPKNSYKLLFDNPGVKGQNMERMAQISWPTDSTSQCSLKYYGGGTRDEYRITRLGTHFKEGELVILCKMTDDQYFGFKLADGFQIDLFLKEFDIERKETNSLIPLDHLIDETHIAEETQSGFLPGNQLPVSKASEIKSASFKPKAHILTLLGEELIKDPVMAIYELIKNSYDADSKSVLVYFQNITDHDNANIVVIDSGTGMTEEVLQNVWLEPGTAFRKPLDGYGKRMMARSPIFHRIPMGEKGVGRFAVHKLGSKIKLISRPCEVILDEKGNFKEKKLLDYEISVEIDWHAFTQSKYLSEVSIKYIKNTDKDSFLFKKESGTYIKISSLKEIWNRGMARKLKRHTLAMTSPKSDPLKFQIDLNFYNNWLKFRTSKLCGLRIDYA